jgi:hypothetical protein
MRLASLQQEFSHRIRSEVDGELIRTLGPGFAIYRNNYRRQLHSALEDTFRRTHLWIGNDSFTSAADVHISQTPPSSWTLDAYGHGFPTTLQCLYPDDPEVGEIAWLDLAMAEAFVAADAEPLTVRDLAHVPWSDAELSFVPSFRMSTALTNAAEIWSALEEKRAPPAAASTAHPCAYVVWRSQLMPCFRVVSRAEHHVLAALYLRAGFEQAVDILVEIEGCERALDTASAMLARWFSDGLIAAVTYKQAPLAGL